MQELTLFQVREVTGGSRPKCTSDGPKQTCVCPDGQKIESKDIDGITVLTCVPK